MRYTPEQYNGRVWYVVKHFSPGEMLMADPRQLQQNRNDLYDLFSGECWVSLTPKHRLEAAQALENSFAFEQGRPAKTVVSGNIPDGYYGGWNSKSDTITLNSNLFERCSLSSDSVAPRPDANMQVFDTIAHEGYHAYQSFALENPSVCQDRQKLHDWALNEGKYYDPEHYAEEYLIQPQERDAWEYGYNRTVEAFEGIQQRCGPEQDSTIAAYEMVAAQSSYSCAMERAQTRNPEILEEMNTEMLQNCQVKGINPDIYSGYGQQNSSFSRSTGPGGETYLKQSDYIGFSHPENQAYNDAYAMIRQGMDPYADDVGQFVMSHTPGGNSTYKPSLREQYLEGVEGFQNQYGKDYNNNPEYQTSLTSLMDDLGYYPQLDRRAWSDYGENLINNSENRSAAEIAGETGLVPRYPEDFSAEKQYEQEEPEEIRGIVPAAEKQYEQEEPEEIRGIVPATEEQYEQEEPEEIRGIVPAAEEQYEQEEPEEIRGIVPAAEEQYEQDGPEEIAGIVPSQSPSYSNDETPAEDNGESNGPSEGPGVSM